MSHLLPESLIKNEITQKGKDSCNEEEPEEVFGLTIERLVELMANSI